MDEAKIHALVEQKNDLRDSRFSHFKNWVRSRFGKKQDIKSWETKIPEKPGTSEIKKEDRLPSAEFSVFVVTNGTSETSALPEEGSRDEKDTVTQEYIEADSFPAKLSSDSTGGSGKQETTGLSSPITEEPHAILENISGILKGKIKENGDINPPEFKNAGVAACIGTNEAAGRGFFEAVQGKNPDGYIVGVGAGNVFTMLHAFQDSVTPKGMILADIDPKMVAVGKLLVDKLCTSDSAADFRKKFFGISENDFLSEMHKVIEGENNVVLKERLSVFPEETWKKIWKGIQRDADPPIKWDEIRSYQYEGQNIDVVGALLDKFQVLKKLADSGNIAVEYADFTNPKFINAVRQLPAFQESTNIIYFSNISDHITNRGTKLENTECLNNLEDYEHSVKPAIYIDTLGQGLNYYLRARASMPDFNYTDFNYRGIVSRSQKPDGLLF